MMTLRIALVAFALAACGTAASPNRSCKAACDKLKSCGLKSSSFSCDDRCGSPDDSCAECVNEKACGDIEGGKCASACTKARFEKQ
jgi:hypothetical protein